MALSDDDPELLPAAFDRTDTQRTLELDHVEIDPGGGLRPSHHGPPLWAWLLLSAAVTAVSSAGVVFATMPEVPTFTLAAWRLQLTSVFLGVAGAFQFWRLPAEDRQRSVRQAGLLALSGAALAVHFGAWVWSVQQTSLSHSLLFVSATPLILAGGAWLLRKPISRGELAGTGVGMVGAVILATAAARSDKQVTIAGDMAALLASFAFVAYLLVGQSLRKWMPTFVYAFPVTGIAASLLTLAAAEVDGARLRAGAGGVFGWAADKHYLPRILYLAVVPGILGHQGFNMLLRYMAPLLITLGCNMEPLIGSVLGWAAGVMAPPGPWTYVGGALIMASTVAVTLAAHSRERAQAAAAVQYTRLQLDEALRVPGQEDAEPGLWPAWPQSKWEQESTQQEADERLDGGKSASAAVEAGEGAGGGRRPGGGRAAAGAEQTVGWDAVMLDAD